MSILRLTGPCGRCGLRDWITHDDADFCVGALGRRLLVVERALGALLATDHIESRQEAARILGTGMEEP